jgi:hypothetical protein
VKEEKYSSSTDPSYIIQHAFQEYGVHVASIIKCTDLYRHSRRYHRVFDYIPPSVTELKEVDKATR